MATKRTWLPYLLPTILLMIGCHPNETTEKTQSPSVDNETAVVVSSEEKLANVKSELKNIKAELAEEGRYNCCVHPACDWCLLNEGECQCYDNLKAGRAVCAGCGLGWHNGQGVMEGIQASQVKWNITHEHGEAGHQH